MADLTLPLQGNTLISTVIPNDAKDKGKMNQTQIDRQFDLIVEDYYEDESGEYAAHYDNRSDVLFRKLILIIVGAMAAMVAFAYVIENPIMIPAAIVVIVAILTYRAMVKDYAKGNKN